MKSMAYNNDWPAVITLSLAMFFRTFAIFLLMPVIAISLADLNSATQATVAFCAGVHGITQAILQIPFGYYSDVYGRKKLLILGLLVFFIGSLLCFIATNIYLVILGRLLQGAGAVGSVILASINDKVSADARPKAVAVFGAGIGAAFIFAMIFAPIIFNSFGLSGIFTTTLLLSIFNITIVSLIKFDNTQEQSSPSPNNFFLSLYSFLVTNKQSWQYFILALVMHLCLSVTFVLLPKFGISISAYNFGIPVLLSVLTISMLPIRKYKDRALMPFTFLLGLGFVVFAANFSFGFMTFLFAFVILETLLPAIVSVSFEKNKGLALGIYSTCQFLGVFLGGALSAFLVGYFNYHVLAITVACLTVLPLAVIFWSHWLVFKPTKSKLDNYA